MNSILWIVAVLLAAVFLIAGAMKLSRTREQLAGSGLSWTADVGGGTIKVIGALEVLTAVGLILPALLGIAPVLVPLAALGIVALMIGATLTHLRRNEGQMIAVNVVLLLLAAVVAWGRFAPYSFAS